MIGDTIKTNTNGVIVDECILYVGPEPWKGMWRNRHQLMSRFAQFNTVFYVEPRIPIKKLLSGIWHGDYKLKDIFRKMFTVTSDDVYVYHSPMWLPVTEKMILRQVFDYGWKLLLRRKAKAIGVDGLALKHPIVWLSRPHLVGTIGLFEEKLLIYHVVDEYLGYYGHTTEGKKRLVQDEQILLKHADVVIVVSESLYKSKSPYNDNIHLVKNAVAYDVYNAATKADIKIKSPILGYTGLISNRLDIVLLNKLAEQHPEWALVFVGDVVGTHCEKEMDELKSKENTHFLGRKSIDVLPSVVKAFDIGMIPYKTDLQADNVSPLKIYEYMAANIPVITTNYSAAREFSDAVSIIDGIDEFESAVFIDLDRNNQDVDKCLRIGISTAQKNTWDIRISEISDILVLGCSEKARNNSF